MTTVFYNMNDLPKLTGEEYANLVAEREGETKLANEIYDRINGMWEASDIPKKVRQTPNWEEGWLRLMTCLSRHTGQPPPSALIENGFPDRLPPGVFRPRMYLDPPSMWWHEVHGFSHMWGSHHGVKHAMLEEEWTRAVLDWWIEQRSKSTAHGTPTTAMVKAT